MRTLIDDFIKNNVLKLSYHNYSYAIVRSLFAIATLSLLCFNDNDVIFGAKFENDILDCDGIINSYNIFCLAGGHYVQEIKVFCIIVLLIVVLGFFPFITGFLQWYIQYSIIVSSRIVDGGDQIISIICLILLPLTFLDFRVNHWIVDKNSSTNNYIKIISFVTLVFCKIQISIIYFFAGVSKMSVEEWRNGTAFYYWSSHPNFGSNDNLAPFLNYINTSPFLITTITWGVILFEIALPYFAFSNYRALKKIVFLIGVLFHLMIWAIHGLFSFGLTMISCLIILLVYHKLSSFIERKVHKLKKKY